MSGVWRYGAARHSLARAAVEVWEPGVSGTLVDMTTVLITGATSGLGRLLQDTTMVIDSGVTPMSSVATGADNVLALLNGPAAQGVTGRYYCRLRELTDELLAKAAPA